MAPHVAKSPLGVSGWEAQMGAAAALVKNKDCKVYCDRLTREIKDAFGKGKYQVDVGIPRARLANTEKNRDWVTGVQEVLRDEYFSVDVVCVKKGETEETNMGVWRSGFLQQEPDFWDDVKSAFVRISWHNKDPKRD